MGQQQPDLTGRRAGLWDIEEWVRRGEAGAAWSTVTSAGIDTSNFELYSPGNSFYLLDVLLSATAQATWILHTHGFPPTGIIFGKNNSLSGTGAPANAPGNYQFGSGAPAPGADQAMSGVVPAGYFGSILGRAKLFAAPSNSWSLYVEESAASTIVVTFVYLAIGA